MAVKKIKNPNKKKGKVTPLTSFQTTSIGIFATLVVVFVIGILRTSFNSQASNPDKKITESSSPIATTDEKTKPNKPLIAVSNRLIDFGQADYQGSVTKTIEIQNPGLQDLVISEVKTPDKSLSVDWQEKILKDNELVNLNITYTPANTNDEGKVFKTMHIFSNASNHPDRDIQIKAEIINYPSGQSQ